VTAYDDVPYECQPIPCTAPEQLAMVSFFHGGPCPPVLGARCLEIGCGDGANLLPLAFHRRDSHFVGVDASHVQIAEAQAAATYLGLTNVTFHAADVRDVASQLGVFDAIVVHGVLSWVPADVRIGVLELCHERLTERGLLYASYNTYPGWKARGLVRDVLRRAAHGQRELALQADDARQLAGFLLQHVPEADHPYAHLLRAELGRVVDAKDAYLVHEYLTEDNRPFWLRDFIALAAEHELRYVADAGFNQSEHTVPDGLWQAVAELDRAPLVAEELIDVLWFRQHRSSLLCRAEVALNERPGLAVFDRATIAAGLQPSSAEPALQADVPQSFVGYFEPDFELEISDPLVKAAIWILATHWPAGMTWDLLMAGAAQRLADAGLDAPDRHSRGRLQSLLLDLFARGHIDLRLRDVPPRMDVSGNPVASRLARYEVARRAMVTGPGHHRLALRPIDRLIVQRLDGTRSQQAIVSELAGRLRTGDLAGMSQEELAACGQTEGAAIDDWVGQQLDRIVRILAMWGLLEG
jgi:SAM-dependent methyltransferase